MKALVYEKAHSLEDFAIKLVEVPEPTLRETDVLVEVRAIGVNPGEAFIPKGTECRTGRACPARLGVRRRCRSKPGPPAHGFRTGDRVFGTGDMTRDGAGPNALAVDHRILARIPNNSRSPMPRAFPSARYGLGGDLPRPGRPADRRRPRAYVGGAGGVGSLATQLLKARTKAFVIATASRPESREWCRKMGADLVIDHTGDHRRTIEISEYPGC